MNRNSNVKELIKKTVIDLLTKKPIEELTVSEVCIKCNIYRTSFYYYYDNIFDVLYELEEKNIDNIIEKYMCISNNNVDAVILYLNELKKSYFSKYAQHNVEKYSKKISDTIISFLNKKTPIDSYSQFIIECKTTCSLMIVAKWINSNYKIETAEIAKLIISINS